MKKRHKDRLFWLRPSRNYFVRFSLSFKMNSFRCFQVCHLHVFCSLWFQFCFIFTTIKNGIKSFAFALNVNDMNIVFHMAIVFYFRSFQL